VGSILSFLLKLDSKYAMRLSTLGVASLAALTANVSAFSVGQIQTRQRTRPAGTTFFEPRGAVFLSLSASVDATTKTGGFIDTELRGMAMKLHTRQQAPKEGQAEEKKQREPYTPTHADYLAFLVDSQHIYKAMEDVVNERDELTVFRNTGLERVAPLETDIGFMVNEYNLERPEVGKPGLEYAAEMRRFGKEGAIPEFLCNYYNHYFAHTAGGRMIGKKMSSLLLDKKTLEFYKVCTLMRMKRRVVAQCLTIVYTTVGW
jgi:hypothetical protein